MREKLSVRLWMTTEVGSMFGQAQHYWPENNKRILCLEYWCIVIEDNNKMNIK